MNKPLIFSAFVISLLLLFPLFATSVTGNFYNQLSSAYAVWNPFPNFQLDNDNDDNKLNFFDVSKLGKMQEADCGGVC